MIAGEGHVICVPGDTDILANVDWRGDLHNPDIGIPSVGAHDIMDMPRAPRCPAVNLVQDGDSQPPPHLQFPAQNAQALIGGSPGVRVTEPQAMAPIPLRYTRRSRKNPLSNASASAPPIPS